MPRALEIFGRLHPLVLHLPIGLLLGALLLEGLAARGKLARPALGAYLCVAALSALVAAAAGWVLAHEEVYGGETLERHERLGIALAVASLLAALLHGVGAGARERAGLRFALYRVALVAACVLLVPAGHLGSRLTHGVDWLDGPRARARDAQPPTQKGEPAPVTPERTAEPAERAESDAYAAAIAPFFAARCASCHGATKRKGGLRLDTREGLLAGGEDGAVLVPGDPAASLLFQRLSLPLEHEDHMPPEGKPQPTEAELAALEEWIRSGAFFGAASDAPVTEEARAEPVQAREPESPRPPGPPEAALAALTRALVHHERLEPESDELWIDVAAVAPSFGDAEVRELLVPLAEWTAELSLARSAVGDEGLAALARFPRLRRLDLRATRLGDAGLRALAGHAALAGLELAQTGVTDGSVELLLALPALREVGLWGTGLTGEGLARLRAVPGLVVEAGDAPAAEVLESEGELAFRSDRPLPGAELVPEALRPVNATCPVSGSPVNPKYSLVHSTGALTRVVGFCCPNCPKEFWAEPAKYESKLP
jgi:uncharacterized membrane protein